MKLRQFWKGDTPLLLIKIMAKYIDAELLRKEVEKNKNMIEALFTEGDDSVYDGENDAYDRILRIIDSLQQEQPEPSKSEFVFPNFLYARTVDNKTIDVSYAPQSMDAVEYIKNDPTEQSKVDLVAELKHHLDTTPKEQLEKEWKELEPWGNIGPTVQEFLYGKQSEVDLEKEIDRFEDWMETYNQADYPTSFTTRDIARHFAEWGKKNTLNKTVEWMKKNLTYTHPRKGTETCMVNIGAFLDAMNEQNGEQNIFPDSKYIWEAIDEDGCGFAHSGRFTDTKRMIDEEIDKDHEQSDNSL